MIEMNTKKALAIAVAMAALAVAAAPAPDVMATLSELENGAEKAEPEQPAQEVQEESAVRVAAAGAKKKEVTGRDARITSATMTYDRKQGIVFFDRDVTVDDEQYQMHADRVYVYLSGTNDVKKLVALGHVSLTNDQRVASCAKATYVKALSRVELFGGSEDSPAMLEDTSAKGGALSGSKIVFWLDSEQVEVTDNRMRLPGGAFKAQDAKKLLGK